jgi:hypothetical protein
MSYVDKDSASLMVLRDESSFITKWSDALSKLSAAFDFDRDLLATKVYEQAYRLSLKKSVRKRNVEVLELDPDPGARFTMQLQHTQASKLRSEYIDNTIAEDRQAAPTKLRLLVLGDPYGRKSGLIKQMKQIEEDTPNKLQAYCSDVLASAVRSAQLLVAAIYRAGEQPDLMATKIPCEHILAFAFESEQAMWLPKEFSNAVEAVWHNPLIRKQLELSKITFSAQIDL